MYWCDGVMGAGVIDSVLCAGVMGVVGAGVLTNMCLMVTASKPRSGVNCPYFFN